MSQKPTISVVLPVYNGEAYVREAVESILAQTFTDFELIIINDGSTDGSGAILRELAERDPRIVLVERANGGLVSALNEGIQRAQAELIARMDADDVAMPERFAQQHAQMEAEPELGVLGSFIRIMDETGRTIRVGDYPVSMEEAARFMEHGCPVAHPTVIMRREAVLRAGGYRPLFAHCEDYDLWLRISELGYGIANLPVVLLRYRMHGNNVSAIHREAQAVATLIARSAHRCRILGLGDPTTSMKRLSPDSLKKFPEQVRLDFEPEMFALKYANISLESRESLLSAWREYEALDRMTLEHPATSGFVLRVARGSLINRAPGLLILAGIAALRHHPRRTASMIAHKGRRSLSRVVAKFM